MPIEPESLIVISAVQEKVFLEQWVYNLNVHAPTPTTGNVRIELLPYDPATQEIGPGSLNQPVQTDKLWQAVNEVPEVAIAFQAVINCVAPLRAWIDAQNATAPELVAPDPEPVAPDPEPVAPDPAPVAPDPEPVAPDPEPVSE